MYHLPSEFLFGGTWTCGEKKKKLRLLFSLACLNWGSIWFTYFQGLINLFQKNNFKLLLLFGWGKKLSNFKSKAPPAKKLRKTVSWLIPQQLISSIPPLTQRLGANIPWIDCPLLCLSTGDGHGVFFSTFKRRPCRVVENRRREGERGRTVGERKRQKREGKPSKNSLPSREF